MVNKNKIAAAAALASLLLAATAPAHAQASSDLPRNAVEFSASNPQATGSAMGMALDGWNAGSSERALPQALVEDTPGYPFPIDESIEEPAVLDKQVEDGRLERWSMASPAMGRVVDVQIYRAADPTAPAPQLIMLDGVSGRDNSGWVREGYVQDVFAGENVTVVMPNEATGSMYTDWQEDDPALGRMQWETFLTAELPPLLAAEKDLNFNGHRGIGGLSMGGGAALRIANQYPDIFDAAIGISGCYSTLDPVGRATTQMTVESRGGDAENMWGEFGSADWIANDVVADPSGLSGMAVYLSSANGVITAEDRARYASGTAQDMATGVVLERGALECTRKLDASMRDAGMDHHVVDYLPAGAHNWTVFGPPLQPAWAAVREELY